MLLGCKQSLILGDLKLNAQIPAQAPRDLHHPPGRGQQCNGEFQNLHLPGNKVHGGDGISEPQGRNSFNLKTKIFKAFKVIFFIKTSVLCYLGLGVNV